MVVADEDLATKAVTKAFVEASPGEQGDPVSSPPRLDLLAATLRISLTRVAENPDRRSDSAVTTALWQLPAEQRAALWLAKVDGLDNPSLGMVLGLTAPNAGHVATRAAEWLDVALDHESGPLCPHETKLVDLLEDHLPAAEAAEMRAHVPGCHTCRTKACAFEELSDLKTVLVAAVPEPPPGLTIETLEQQERALPSAGQATLAEGALRTPAVRPLAACCAALLVVALIGIGVIRGGSTASDSPSSSDSNAIVPGASTSPISGGVVGSSITLPPASATTLTVTTTSVPAVTFPTIKGR